LSCLSSSYSTPSHRPYFPHAEPYGRSRDEVAVVRTWRS
jgi:hypothetical protein